MSDLAPRIYVNGLQQRRCERQLVIKIALEHFSPPVRIETILQTRTLPNNKKHYLTVKKLGKTSTTCK